MKKLPQTQLITFYPTVTLFVDDDTGFLKGIDEFLLGEPDVVPRFFNNPERAVQFLNEQHPKETWLEKCLSTTFDSDDEDPMVTDIQLHIDKLYQRIYDPKRFSDVSMAVLDYKMPQGSGREFLTKIVNLSIAKGILSGVMKSDEAVSGFNLKDFDLFLNKLDDNVADQLIDYVRKSQKLYFAALSSEIIKHHPKLNAVLSNENFSRLFENFVKQYHIVEYYLLDNNGSFLLLDEHAKAYLLAVTHEEDLEAYYTTAKLADDKPSQDLLNKIKARIEFPFFLNQDIADLTPAMWDDHMLRSESLDSSGIYYHLLTDTQKYGISLDKVKSFAAYQAEQKRFG